MTTTFTGMVRIPGSIENGLPSTITLDAQMLVLTAGGTELGRWNRNELKLRREPDGSFHLTLGREVVLFNPDSPLEFAILSGMPGAGTAPTPAPAVPLVAAAPPPVAAPQPAPPVTPQPMVTPQPAPPLPPQPMVQPAPAAPMPDYSATPPPVAPTPDYAPVQPAAPAVPPMPPSPSMPPPSAVPPADAAPVAPVADPMVAPPAPAPFSGAPMGEVPPMVPQPPMTAQPPVASPETMAPPQPMAQPPQPMAQPPQSVASAPMGFELEQDAPSQQVETAIVQPEAPSSPRSTEFWDGFYAEESDRQMPASVAPMATDIADGAPTASGFRLEDDDAEEDPGPRAPRLGGYGSDLFAEEGDGPAFAPAFGDVEEPDGKERAWSYYDDEDSDDEKRSWSYDDGAATVDEEPPSFRSPAADRDDLVGASSTSRMRAAAGWRPSMPSFSFGSSELGMRARDALSVIDAILEENGTEDIPKSFIIGLGGFAALLGIIAVLVVLFG
jgi:hypothetical protein